MRHRHSIRGSFFGRTRGLRSMLSLEELGLVQGGPMFNRCSTRVGPGGTMLTLCLGDKENVSPGDCWVEPQTEQGVEGGALPQVLTLLWILQPQSLYRRRARSNRVTVLPRNYPTLKIAPGQAVCQRICSLCSKSALNSTLPSNW